MNEESILTKEKLKQFYVNRLMNLMQESNSFNEIQSCYAEVFSMVKEAK